MNNTAAIDNPMYRLGFDAGWADAAADRDTSDHPEWPEVAQVAYLDGFDAFITAPVQGS